MQFDFLNFKKIQNLVDTAYYLANVIQLTQI